MEITISVCRRNIILQQYYSDLFHVVLIYEICLQREVVKLLLVGRNDWYHDRGRMDDQDQQIPSTSETGITLAPPPQFKYPNPIKYFFLAKNN